MRLLILLAFCSPNQDPASRGGPYDLTGDIRIKSFLINDEPDLMRNDYANYDGKANYELRLRNYASFSDTLKLNAEPYLWSSEKNQISRLGLIGELKHLVAGPFNPDVYESCIGYGHHSWHNADVDSPNNEGRQQDWLFAQFHHFRFWSCSESRLDIYSEIRFYLNNKQPIEIKDRYGNDEEAAHTQIGFRVRLQWHEWLTDFRPYWQISYNHSLFGFRNEFAYSINNKFSLFLETDYYRIHNEDRSQIAIGTMAKFK